MNVVQVQQVGEKPVQCQCVQAAVQAWDVALLAGLYRCLVMILQEVYNMLSCHSQLTVSHTVWRQLGSGCLIMLHIYAKGFFML